MPNEAKNKKVFDTSPKKKGRNSSTVKVPVLAANLNDIFPVHFPDGGYLNTSLSVDAGIEMGQYSRVLNDHGDDDSPCLMAYVPVIESGIPEELAQRMTQICTISDVLMQTMIEGRPYVIVNHLSRAQVVRTSGFSATVIPMDATPNRKNQQIHNEYCNLLVSTLKKHAAELDIQDAIPSLESYRDCGDLADSIAVSILRTQLHKAEVYVEINPVLRAKKAYDYLIDEISMNAVLQDVESKTAARQNQAQRDYYLREKLHVIEDELGISDDSFVDRIQEAKLPEEVQTKLLKDAERLKKLPTGSPDQAVLASYLETVLSLPWHTKSDEVLDLEQARIVLDRDHDGLEKVKQRIVEYIAVRKRNPEHRNQILCLVGPPGTGKTSVIASIAEAMGRKYIRVSLGGIRDESDIRGHRKTYIGSMPGRIMEGLSRAGVSNPIMLLDELDKMTRDAHGDPASALLEVLDSEQNKVFRDHFIEVPFDLSDVIFIGTANTLDTVPRPLIDRLDIIELNSYTQTEKISIARHHLIPKQLARHGLRVSEFSLTDGALKDIISGYTREAGVRNLERMIATLARKGVLYLSEHPDKKSFRVNQTNLETYLGPRKITDTLISGEDEVGVVNGLAYTETGGELLKVEAAVLEGSGKIELTGSLGDVMKESAHLAVSYVRSIADEYKIEPDFYKSKDIHIHFPEGAVPKDGPSAGVTMVTALVSALTRRPVRRDVAMTGEITLRGQVLPIGGLREKTMGAYVAGVSTVYLPKKNEPDLSEIDSEVKSHLKFVPVSDIGQILNSVLRNP